MQGDPRPGQPGPGACGPPACRRTPAGREDPAPTRQGRRRAPGRVFRSRPPARGRGERCPPPKPASACGAARPPAGPGGCHISCKPGSVPGVPGGSHSSRTRVATRLQRPTRTPRAGSRPARLPGRCVPTRSCSRRGLPCRPRCRGRGALLPHRFALAGTGPARPSGGVVSVALSLGSPPAGVTRRRRSAEPGLSSAPAQGLRSGCPDIWHLNDIAQAGPMGQDRSRTGGQHGRTTGSRGGRF